MPMPSAGTFVTSAKRGKHVTICQMQEGLKPVPSGGKLVENKRGALGLHERRKKIREYIEHENDDLCTD